jgi:hypothetical protein
MEQLSQCCTEDPIHYCCRNTVTYLNSVIMLMSFSLQLLCPLMASSIFFVD